MRRRYCQRHECEQAEKTNFCFHGFAFATGIQTPIAPFVHPKLPLTHSWDFAGERAVPVAVSGVALW